MTPAIAERTLPQASSTGEANPKTRRPFRARMATSCLIGFWLAVFATITFQFGFQILLGLLGFAFLIVFVVLGLTKVAIGSCGKAISEGLDRPEYQGLGSSPGSKRSAAVRAGSVRG